jgi:hypothetical protein
VRVAGSRFFEPTNQLVDMLQERRAGVVWRVDGKGRRVLGNVTFAGVARPAPDFTVADER